MVRFEFSQVYQRLRVKHRLFEMAKERLHIPDILPVNPISLICPFCKAEPNRDCSTSSEGFSVLHIARIVAVAKGTHIK
jgi:hypothetical protein